jgi:hypothetical protein
LFEKKWHTGAAGIRITGRRGPRHYRAGRAPARQNRRNGVLRGRRGGRCATSPRLLSTASPTARVNRVPKRWSDWLRLVGVLLLAVLELGRVNTLLDQ